MIRSTTKLYNPTTTGDCGTCGRKYAEHRDGATPLVKICPSEQTFLTRTGTITETLVLFRNPDGSALALRGFVGEPTDTQLVVSAQALGAVSWRTLGEVEGSEFSTNVTEVDYRDGVKAQTRTRLIGTDGRVGPICDCGKGSYCPAFGVDAR